MALTKQALLQVLQIVKSLQDADVGDKAQIEQLQAQADQFKAEHDLVNDPEVNSALDAVLVNAAHTPPVDAVEAAPVAPDGETAPPAAPVNAGEVVPAPEAAPEVPAESSDPSAPSQG